MKHQLRGGGFRKKVERKEAEKEEEEKEESEAQKKPLVDKTQRTICKSTRAGKE